MEIIPAGEEGAGLVIEINKKAGDEEKSEDWPVSAKKFAYLTKLPDWEAVLCFGNILGHELV